jgi:hypothetical protein
MYYLISLLHFTANTLFYPATDFESFSLIFFATTLLRAIKRKIKQPLLGLDCSKLVLLWQLDKENQSK